MSESVRFDRVVVEFYIEFEGARRMVLDLGVGDQSDPRLAAIVAWTQERNRAAAIAAEGGADPTLLA